jgi:hypothetical protein
MLTRTEMDFQKCKGLPRKVAQAAAKKSWENRKVPNLRDRVDDLSKRRQIIVKNLSEVNALYVAARRRRVPTRVLGRSV